MIVDFFRQFLTLFLILFLGFSFLNLFKPKVSFIEKISAGFMLGVGISTFGLFLLGFAGYSFNYWNVFTILLVGNLILVVANKFFKRSYLLPSSNEIRRCFLTLNALEKICLVGILFFVLSSLLQNLYWPIWMWDAVQLYDYRAKLIVSSQSIFFPARTFYDVSYPLLTSILHSVLYISGSTNPQYVYTLIFACLIGLVYSFIKENTSRLIAFVVSFFISFYPLFYSHSTQPLTNIVHSTYIVSSLFYLLRWFESKSKGLLFLSGLLFSFSMFTRKEPLWIFTAVLVVLAVLIFRRKEVLPSFLNFVVFFIIPNFLMVYLHGRYILHFSFSDKPTYGSFFEKVLENIQWVNIFNTLWDSVAMIYKGMLFEVLVPFVVFLLVIFLVRRRIVVGELLKVLALFNLGYLLCFWLSSWVYRIRYSYSEFRALESSLERLTIFWKVLVFVFLAILLKEVLFLGLKK